MFQWSIIFLHIAYATATEGPTISKEVPVSGLSGEVRFITFDDSDKSRSRDSVITAIRNAFELPERSHPSLMQGKNL